MLNRILLAHGTGDKGNTKVTVTNEIQFSLRRIYVDSHDR